jgi:hypothetical protein
MNIRADNELGLSICSTLMIREGVTESEKDFLRGVEQEIMASLLTFRPSGETVTEIKRMYWRRKPRRRGKVSVEIEEVSLDGDYSDDVPGLSLRCTRCDHEVEVFGTGEDSAKAGAVMLREECPRRERNFYDVSEWDG